MANKSYTQDMDRSVGVLRQHLHITASDFCTVALPWSYHARRHEAVYQGAGILSVVEMLFRLTMRVYVVNARERRRERWSYKHAE